MKKFLSGLLLLSAVGLTANAEEITVTFSELGLDNSATLTDYKVNEYLTFTSDGTYNDSNSDFRLGNGKSFKINITDATLTAVNITCTSGYGFGYFSPITVDNVSDGFAQDLLSWTGEATQSWNVTASLSSGNVRMKSITLTYTPKVVAQDITTSISCMKMGLSNEESLPATGYDVNEYINVNFLQGTHTSQPTYRTSVNAFYIFNGQQVVVTAKNNARLLKIEVETTGNTFGYGGTVTADGVTQTYETDYTWVPCKWEGTAEQNVVFTNGGKTGNTQVTGLTITYRTPGEGEVSVSRPVITPNNTDNTVTITCDTEGASIYYTLDDTDPSVENGILYDSVITLDNPCTVKSIAYYEGVASSVASLQVYLNVVESLDQFFVNASPNIVRINCPVTAITATGSYLIVKDNQGSYGMIYKNNQDLYEALDVENGATWSYIMARYYPYGEFAYVEVVDLGEVSQGSPVEPVLITIPDVEDDKTVQYEYVQLNNVDITYLYSWSTKDILFTDEDGNELDGIKFFPTVDVPISETDEDRYDVTGIIVWYDEDEYYELWPLVVVKSGSSAIGSINKETESEAVYYNLNGIKVDKPSNGIHIRVKDGKAEKVLNRH